MTIWFEITFKKAESKIQSKIIMLVYSIDPLYVKKQNQDLSTF